MDFSQSKHLALFLSSQVVLVFLVSFFVTGEKANEIQQLENSNRNLIAQIQALSTEETIPSEEVLDLLLDQELHLKSELDSLLRTLHYEPPAEFVMPSNEQPSKYFLNILNECNKVLRRKITIRSDLLGFPTDIPAEKDIPSLLILLSMAQEIAEEAHISNLRSIEKMLPIYRSKENEQEEAQQFLLSYDYQFEFIGEARALLKFLHKIQSPQHYYSIKSAQISEEKNRKGFLRLKVTLSKLQLKNEVKLKLEEIEEDESETTFRRY